MSSDIQQPKGDSHSSYPPPYYYQDDEITLKELILKIQEFARTLWSNKFLIIVISFLFTSGSLLRTWQQDTTYSSGISFMVSDSDSGDRGLVNTPYGPVELGSISANKITELSRSGRIVHQVLLTNATVDGKEDFIANHLIDIYTLHEKWNNEPINNEYRDFHLKDFVFSHSDIEIFTQQEKRALSILHQLVAGNNLINKQGILSVKYNEDSEIFRLNVSALNESISLILAEQEFQELKNFYVEETVGKSLKGHAALKVETDSLFALLSSTERVLASSQDRSRGVQSSLQNIRITRQQREVSRLEQEYRTSQQNLKQLELLLNSETPEFAVIDRTFFPIKNAPSRIKAIIIGGILGLFLSSLFVIGRKIVRDAMV